MSTSSSLPVARAINSGASRTSPILRGNWIYETLLGESLPRPPANVPDLPERIPENLTARQVIEKHSSVKECAKCHERIDTYGFVLERMLCRLGSEFVVLIPIIECYYSLGHKPIETGTLPIR